MKIYRIDDIKRAIKKVGLKKGDAVFIFLKLINLVY